MFAQRRKLIYVTRGTIVQIVSYVSACLELLNRVSEEGVIRDTRQNLFFQTHFIRLIVLKPKDG